MRRIAYLEQRAAASLVSVGDASALPAAAIISWPNPAHGRVRFSIAAARAGARGARAILVFSVAGRRVARLSVERSDIEWDGRDASGLKVASGLYFARLEGDARAAGTKFMLLE